jgi:hypothetical protein
MSVADMSLTEYKEFLGKCYKIVRVDEDGNILGDTWERIHPKIMYVQNRSEFHPDGLTVLVLEMHRGDKTKIDRVLCQATTSIWEVSCHKFREYIDDDFKGVVEIGHDDFDAIVEIYLRECRDEVITEFNPVGYKHGRGNI